MIDGMAKNQSDSKIIIAMLKYITIVVMSLIIVASGPDASAGSFLSLASIIEK
jgi:hypothetical protein